MFTEIIINSHCLLCSSGNTDTVTGLLQCSAESSELALESSSFKDLSSISLLYNIT